MSITYKCEQHNMDIMEQGNLKTMQIKIYIYSRLINM